MQHCRISISVKKTTDLQFAQPRGPLVLICIKMSSFVFTQMNGRTHDGQTSQEHNASNGNLTEPSEKPIFRQFHLGLYLVEIIIMFSQLVKGFSGPTLDESMFIKHINDLQQQHRCCAECIKKEHFSLAGISSWC